MNRKIISMDTLRLGILFVMVLTLICTNPLFAAVDPNKVIDLRADALKIEGGKKEMVLDGALWVQKAVVIEGITIGLICDWSANLVGAAYWKTNVNQTWQVIIKRDDGTLGFGPASMPAGTQLGKKTTKSSGLKIPTPTDPIPYEASSTTSSHPTSFKGSFGPIQWTAQGEGKHKFECVVPKTGFEEPTLENNIATAYVEVVPKLKAGTPTGPSVAQPKAGLLPVPPAAKPKVGIPPGQAVATGAGVPAGPPDITSNGKVVVAGKSSAWRGMIVVDAKNAARVSGGQCEFPVQYTVRNAGISPTGPFGSLWQNNPPTGSFSRSWMPIAPGSASTQTDLVMLKPGQNVLRLALDNEKQVAESNEGNNMFQLTVNVTGICGTAPVVRGGATVPSRGVTPPPAPPPLRTLPAPPVRGR
jgi:hypothetical protein